MHISTKFSTQEREEALIRFAQDLIVAIDDAVQKTVGGIDLTQQRVTIMRNISPQMELDNTELVLRLCRIALQVIVIKHARKCVSLPKKKNAIRYLLQNSLPFFLSLSLIFFQQNIDKKRANISFLKVLKLSNNLPLYILLFLN